MTSSPMLTVRADHRTTIARRARGLLPALLVVLGLPLGALAAQRPFRTDTAGDQVLAADRVVAARQRLGTVPGRLTEGAPRARVQVLEVLDYQCPACRTVSETFLASFRARYIATGQVQLLSVPIALPQHPLARMAGLAVLCARPTGRATALATALYANQDRWTRAPDPAAAVTGLRRALGPLGAVEQACPASAPMQQVWDATQAQVRAAGIGNTPTFLINGRVVPVMGPADLLAAVDAALAEGAHAPR